MLRLVTMATGRPNLIAGLSISTHRTLIRSICVSLLHTSRFTPPASVFQGYSRQPNSFNFLKSVHQSLYPKKKYTGLESVKFLSGLTNNKGDNRKDMIGVEVDNRNLPIRDRLRHMIGQYGKVTLGVYLAIDVISLGSFYTLVKSGVDVSGLITMMGLSNSKWMTPGASTAVVAFAAHKLFSPIRLLMTLGLTPYVVKVLQRMNYLPTTQKPTIQEMKQEYQIVKKDLKVAIKLNRQQASSAIRAYRNRLQTWPKLKRRRLNYYNHGNNTGSRR